MAGHDVKNDTTPANLKKLPSLPTVAALKAAIAGSAFAASYPAAQLQLFTENDLIAICRQHSIAVAGL